MLTYKVVYRLRDGMILVDVPGFPGVTAFGKGMHDARSNIASALKYAAELKMKRGEVLPICETEEVIGDSYMVETASILPQGEVRAEVMVR
jgi:predicted RNase H-like HicB family nuclease